VANDHFHSQHSGERKLTVGYRCYNDEKNNIDGPINFAITEFVVTYLKKFEVLKIFVLQGSLELDPFQADRTWKEHVHELTVRSSG